MFNLEETKLLDSIAGSFANVESEETKELDKMAADKSDAEFEPLTSKSDMKKDPRSPSVKFDVS